MLTILPGIYGSPNSSERFQIVIRNTQKNDYALNDYALLALKKEADKYGGLIYSQPSGTETIYFLEFLNTVNQQLFADLTKAVSEINQMLLKNATPLSVPQYSMNSSSSSSSSAPKSCPPIAAVALVTLAQAGTVAETDSRHTAEIERPLASSVPTVSNSTSSKRLRDRQEQHREIEKKRRKKIAGSFAIVANLLRDASLIQSAKDPDRNDILKLCITKFKADENKIEQLEKKLAEAHEKAAPQQQTLKSAPASSSLPTLNSNHNNLPRLGGVNSAFFKFVKPAAQLPPQEIDLSSLIQTSPTAEKSL